MNILTSIKNIIISLLSLFFLITGVYTLIGSYHSNNPMIFLMYFFSASLLILVSIAGIIYGFFRLFPQKQNGLSKDETI